MSAASAARPRPLRMTRRTSSAVTIPSPLVVCSRTMTWPLFSPPRPGARDEHPLEDVLVADGGADDVAAGRLDDRLQAAVREDRDDDRRSAGHREPSRSSARMPRTWSPSTTSAARVDRDQPVGVAVEREPDVGAPGDDRLGERGRAVAPHRRLMFTPSGSAWMTSTAAPVAGRISDPRTAPEPLAQSSTRRVPDARTCSASASRWRR